MPAPVTDAVLGSRFWLINNFSALENVQDANAPGLVHIPENAPANVKHDAEVFSFVASEGDEMVRSAINRAEMFTSRHTLTDNDRQLAEDEVNRVANILLPDGIKDDFIARAVHIFTVRGLDGDANDLCTKAFKKLMLTREFSSRAELGEPLGMAGQKALMNAVLGLAKMLGGGSISESAVVELANGNFYDASKKTDLLRLAADSAKKVCDKFVGAEKFVAVVAQCRTALNNAQGIPQQRRQEIEGMVQLLETAMSNAVRERKEVVDFIKCDYLFTDATGNTKSDSDFQSKQLEQIRDSLRAFRYNVDKCRGQAMTRMEGVRRYFDNLRSSFSRTMITRETYQALKHQDDEFNAIARGIFSAIDPNQNLEGLFEAVSIDASAADATRLSHLTNDRIRYHYSGIEQKQKKAAAAFREELEAAVGSGGSRSVTFSVGADVLIGIDAEWARLQAKIGGSGVFTASIKMSNAGGKVDVTFTKGGEIHAGADAKFGSDPDSEDGSFKVPGLGVNGSASIKGAYSRSVTKTYASLEEFVQTVGRHSRLVNPRVREYIYTFGKDVIRGIGHGVMLGLTNLGFRIHRSNMDQVAYAAELRKRDVFGPMSGILLPRRNVEILSKTTDSTKTGSFQAEGEAGIYFSKGKELATDKKLGGGIQYSYSRINNLNGKAYNPVATSLAGYSEAYLTNRFNLELNRYTGNDLAVQNWIASLRNLIGGVVDVDGAVGAIARITELFDDLEADAVSHEQSDRDYWVVFAQRARMLAAAAALLAKCADAFPEARPVAKSVREYLLPRIANPAVRIPEDVFLEEMHDSFNVTIPPKSRHVTRLTFTYDMFQSTSEDMLAKGAGSLSEKIGELSPAVGQAVSNVAGSEPGKAVLGSLQGDFADFGREMAGFNGKLEFVITKENNLSTVADNRPWENGNKLMIEARIPDALPLRLLIELIARLVVKSKTGNEDIGDVKVFGEIKDAILDTVKTTVEKSLVEGGEKLLETGIGELAKKSAKFASLLGTLAGMGAKYESSDDTYKTIRLNFVNGRFSNFVIAEDYDYRAKFSIKPLPFIGVNFGMSSNTSTNDYSVYTKPSFPGILGVANDYNNSGNQEAFKNFLFRNKKGVMRLMRAAADNGPADVEGDSSWREDRDWFQNMVNTLPDRIAEIAEREDALGEEATLLLPKLRAAIADAQNADPAAAAAVLIPIAQRLFSTVAAAYLLTANAA